REELRNWLQAASRHDLDLRNETFLKLMVAWRLRDRQAGGPFAVLAAERRACLARLREVTEARERGEKDNAGLPALLMLDLAILRLSAFHQWLERCEEM